MGAVLANVTLVGLSIATCSGDSKPKRLSPSFYDSLIRFHSPL